MNETQVSHNNNNHHHQHHRCHNRVRAIPTPTDDVELPNDLREIIEKID